MNKISLFTCLLVASLALAPALKSGQSPAERQILTVSATGSERVEATVADVRLAIEERGQTDAEARERLARRSNRVLEFLRGQEVDRLKTTSLRLHPIYDYTKGDREVVGFQAMSVIEFRSSAAGVAPIIDEAIAQGANQVQQLEFTVPEEVIEEARQKALQSATRLALKRADTVLEELGLQRQRIVRIHIGRLEQEPPFPPMPRMAMRAMAEESTATDVEAGESEVTASVTLEVGY